MPVRKVSFPISQWPTVIKHHRWLFCKKKIPEVVKGFLAVRAVASGEWLAFLMNHRDLNLPAVVFLKPQV